MTTVAVVGLGYVGLPLAVEFGKKHRTIGFDLSREKVASYARHVDPTGEVTTDDLRAATLLSVGTDRRRAGGRRFHHRRRPDSGRRRAPAGFRSAARRVAGGRQAHEARRDDRLRIDGLSRRHRGDLHPGAGEAFRDEMEDRFSRRLFAGAHQSRRQGAHADEDHESRVGRHAGDARAGRADVRQRGHGGRAPRVQHQGRRGRQGDREHAARSQHRADERARDHLRPARHQHDGSAARGRQPSGTSCRSARGSSAGTASASIRIT